MKRKPYTFQDISASADDTSGAAAPGSGAKVFWKSIEEKNAPDHLQSMKEAEFPFGLAKMAEKAKNEGDDAPVFSVDRRNFLKFGSAAAALFGLEGCVRRPVEKLMPYTRAPEQVIPGISNHYASVLNRRGEALGVLVESHEGRPTKIEGNPDHPSSRGGTDLIAQAAIWDLYDPDRSTSPKNASADAKWEQFQAYFASTLKAHEGDQGARLRVLAEPTNSPTFVRLRDAVRARFPQARFHTYTPVDDANAREGARIAFGQPLNALYDYARAKVIVSLESDFLETEPGTVRATRLFGEGRRVRSPGDTMSRLYVIESTHSLTGSNADHRLRLPSGDIERYARALAKELALAGVDLGPVAGALGQSDASGIPEKWLKVVAKELAANRGRAVVVVGSRQPASVHALAHALNRALGSVGQTVHYAPVADAQEKDATGDLRSLGTDLEAGKVDTLLVLGGNPVYDAPADVKFADRLAKAKNTIHLSTHVNETSEKCAWHLPKAHELEAWGDQRSLDGTWSIQQPLILPLHGGKSEIEVLAWMVPELANKKAYDLVRDTMKSAPSLSNTAALAAVAPEGVAPAAPAAAAAAAPGAPAAPGAARLHVNGPVPPAAGAARAGAAGGGAVRLTAASTLAPVVPAAGAPAAAAPVAAPAVPAPSAFEFERQWKTALQKGIIGGSAPAAFTPSDVRAADIAAELSKAPAKRAPATAQAVEVVFLPCPKLHDGRHANNPWLLELPDPMTKIVWDNAALISPKTASELGIKNGDVIELSREGASITIPAWILAGQADNSIGLRLGWGRPKPGRYGKEHGFNVNALRTSDSLGFASGVTVRKTGTTHEITQTQDHDSMEGRPVAIDTTLEEYRSNPSFTQYRSTNPRTLPLWNKQDYSKGHQWGMSIDLNQCTGCNACVIACQAENNIPTVGKTQVGRGREMHWLRIDRYFVGNDVADPQVAVQPLMCVHCEEAPCENVCPVNATEHSPEGLNDMAYNRCIGTRYCANNCPYKVRKFNYLEFQGDPLYGDMPETVKMQFNPNVTVRMRGVMEKCTYCVQRIQEAKIAEKRNGKPMRDGAFTTACAQACPAGGIVFGDLNDPKSRVAELRKRDRSYALLADLGTHPRTTYLGKIRNPNKDMA
ncbi:TAT-variant-translocated molybdopterin oxidoreductase [Pendulispora albinea]|uniref:TAT-variant-translocated molybdopterin oxidoreductase n=1 Tax=Pendulispora albinea TaxID=2741071 RepID=A0ABZ2LQ86_9BACT